MEKVNIEQLVSYQILYIYIYIYIYIYTYIYIYIYIYFRSLDKGGGAWGHAPSFCKIAFCQKCFLGNLLLCHSPRHPKLFWPRDSQNFVGGLYIAWKNCYNLASSGYGYSDFPLTNISF